jgi:hypothetical protein
MKTPIHWALLGMLMLAPWTSWAEEPKVMLVLDLVGSEVSPAQIRTFTDLVATSWSRFDGLSVLTNKDLEQALGVEAQKKALGCDDDGCLAEIAGALGADYVALGSVGVLGEVRVFNLSLYDAKNARSVSRRKIETRDVEEVPALIDASVDTMAQEGLGISLAASEKSSLKPIMLWGGVALAVVGAGGAIALTALAYTQESDLASGKSEDPDQSLANGRLFTGLAIGSAVLGAAGLGLLGFGLVSE